MVKKPIVFDFGKIMGQMHRIIRSIASNNGNNPDDFEIIVEPKVIDAIFSSQISDMRQFLKEKLLDIFSCDLSKIDDVNLCFQCGNCVISNTALSCGESITNVFKELDPAEEISKSVRIMMVIIVNRKTGNFYVVLLDNSYKKAPRHHKDKDCVTRPDDYTDHGRGTIITDRVMFDFKRQHDTPMGLNYAVLVSFTPEKMRLIERFCSCLCGGGFRLLESAFLHFQER